jgi:hypothetical protein
MLAKVKQVAAGGAAVASVGWVIVVSPAVVNAQPLPISQDNGITCPHIAGVQYVREPDNSAAYYVCADGLQQDHYVCPPVTKLDMGTTPPTCFPGAYEGKP